MIKNKTYFNMPVFIVNSSNPDVVHSIKKIFSSLISKFDVLPTDSSDQRSTFEIDYSLRHYQTIVRNKYTCLIISQATNLKIKVADVDCYYCHQNVN